MHKLRFAGAALVLAALCGGPVRAQPAAVAPETAVAPVLADIGKNEQTVESAWQQKRLDGALVVAALGSWQLVGAGIALPSGDMKLARDLVQTLLRHQPQILDKPQNLPSRTLLHIANVLGAQKDERAVALYEEVLSRQAKRSPVWPDEVDAAIYNLATYYQRTGQLQKAVDTESRIYNYTTFAPLLANFELQIGRLYAQMGDAEQAAQWYEVAEARNDGRASGVARMDRAETLFNQGKTAQARQVLLEMAQAPNKQPIQIALWTRLAQSYLDEGDPETANTYVQTALAQLRALPAKSNDPYLVAFGPMAEQLAKHLQAKLDNPFFWQNEAANFFLNKDVGAQRLTVKFKTAPTGEISFECANPALRLEPVAPDPKTPLQRAVLVSFDAARFNAKALEHGNQTFIVARSPEFPETARLPVNLYLPAPATAMQ